MSLLTPPGMGAIAVLRLEGGGASAILERLFRPHRASTVALEADRIVHGRFWQANELIDEALVVATAGTPAAGRSRPEDWEVIDICAHGGLRVGERMVLALTEAGATLVEHAEKASHPWPAANRIEQEVWEALARTRTRRAVRFLLRQRWALPAELRRLARETAEDAASAVAGLRTLLARARGCRFLIEGATIAISGPPNTGKSTLANRLVGAERALVSPRPGTTLDWVEHEAALWGVPVTLVDTPGYGPSTGALDALAAARARARAATADLHLRVFDGSKPPPDDREGWSPPGKPALGVLNKRDLGSVWFPSVDEGPRGRAMISISAARDTNLDELIWEIGRMLDVNWADENIISLFTDRQERLARTGLKLPGDEKLTGRVLRELLGEEDEV